MADLQCKVESTSNPWSTDSHIQLGSIQRILTIIDKHERTGLPAKENTNESVSKFTFAITVVLRI